MVPLKPKRQQNTLEKELCYSRLFRQFLIIPGPDHDLSAPGAMYIIGRGPFYSRLVGFFSFVPENLLFRCILPPNYDAYSMMNILVAFIIPLVM